MEVEENEMTIQKLEKEIKHVLDAVDHGMNPLDLLEFIDDIHRLGFGYRFRDNTANAISRIIHGHSDQFKDTIHHSLHASALYFRLTRQHGYYVSTEIFERFKDENGKMSARITKDIEGMLSLYEASHLAFVEETMMDEARQFCRFHLNNIVKAGKIEKKMGERVRHALQLPFHQTMQRLEARWYIQMYDNQNQPNKLLHKLAILDFNSLQFEYQQELHEVSRWWSDVGLADNLSFARNVQMESFFWSLGMTFEPKHAKCRQELTKIVNLITVIDDIYDVYGSPSELELFTDAIQRWELGAINELPDYMRLCFLALYNTVNSIGYNILKQKGIMVIPHLQQVWSDLCKVFLEEAKWVDENRIPKFDEYLNKRWLSSSGAVLLTHAYFLTTQNITNEAIQYLTQYKGLLEFPCKIFRLSNDLSSSKAEMGRGEGAKAVTCYMQETGLSEETAIIHMRNLMDQNWKLMNKEMVHNSIFEKSFIEIAMNLARIAVCQYQNGDAHSFPDDIAKDRVLSVLIHPIQ